jgi:hypothetical protein
LAIAEKRRNQLLSVFNALKRRVKCSKMVFKNTLVASSKRDRFLLSRALEIFRRMLPQYSLVERRRLFVLGMSRLMRWNSERCRARERHILAGSAFIRSRFQKLFFNLKSSQKHLADVFSSILSCNFCEMYAKRKALTALKNWTKCNLKCKFIWSDNQPLSPSVYMRIQKMFFSRLKRKKQRTLGHITSGLLKSAFTALITHKSRQQHARDRLIDICQSYGQIKVSNNFRKLNSIFKFILYK